MHVLRFQGRAPAPRSHSRSMRSGGAGFWARAQVRGCQAGYRCREGAVVSHPSSLPLSGKRVHALKCRSDATGRRAVNGEGRPSLLPLPFRSAAMWVLAARARAGVVWSPDRYPQGDGDLHLPFHPQGSGLRDQAQVQERRRGSRCREGGSCLQLPFRFTARWVLATRAGARIVGSPDRYPPVAVWLPPLFASFLKKRAHGLKCRSDAAGRDAVATEWAAFSSFPADSRECGLRLRSGVAGPDAVAAA